MKQLTKIAFACLFVACSAMTVQAQLGKLKGKANALKKKNTKTTETSSSGGSSGGSGSVAPAKNSEAVESAKSFIASRAGWYANLQADFPMSKFHAEVTAEKYNEYQERKKTYGGALIKDAETDGHVASIDAFYAETFPGKIGEFETYLKETILQGAFDESQWKEYPKTGIRKLDAQLAKFETPYPGIQAQYDGVKKTLTDQKAKIQHFIDSGESDKHKAAANQAKVDARRMKSAGKTDPTLEAFVKKNHSTGHYGELKRVVLLSDWKIEKAVTGIPLKKFLNIQVAVSKDGICDLRKGHIYQDYEGAGKYGPMKLAHYGSPDEINCNNIFK